MNSNNTNIDNNNNSNKKYKGILKPPHKITYMGKEFRSILALCKELDLKYTTVKARILELGWGVEEAVEGRDAELLYETRVETYRNRVGTRLTPELVLEIRRRYAQGNTSYSILAKEYSVGLNTIAKVITRQSWQDI